MTQSNLPVAVHPMTTTTTVTGGFLTLTVSGDLDAVVAAALHQRILDLIRSTRTGLILDFSGVTFCCAATLRVLAHTADAAHVAGIGFVLVSDRRIVLRTIDVAGLRPHLAVHRTLDTAHEILTEQAFTRRDTAADPRQSWPQSGAGKRSSSAVITPS